MSHERTQPYQYSENLESQVHPLSGLELDPASIDTITNTMQQIDQRREELAPETPSQIFAGIATNKAGENTLLVVDSNNTGAEHPQYVVRTTALTGPNAGRVEEEYIPDHPSARTYDRSPFQTISTSSIGEVTVGLGSPDPRFETTSQDAVPFATVRGSDGKHHRAIALSDALQKPTQAELVAAARNALTVDNHTDRYPNVSNKPVQIEGKWHSSGRRDQVESQLKPIVDALGSPELGPKERERLVNLGHQILALANDNPESRGQVLDIEQARAMATAEAPIHEQPLPRFFGRKAAREERNVNAMLAASDAEHEYQQSLKRPQDQQ